jgi:type II secretory pathway component PulK
MDFRELFKPANNKRGMALLIVLGAVAILGYLVSEFTLVAQTNQRVAYSSADRVQAYYLAKSAYKISLLRLKAYQNLRGFLDSEAGKMAAGAIPAGALDQVWRFPLAYPIPTEMPGLTPGQRSQIQKFQDNSALDGSFTALIESESSGYNLNLLFAQFAPKPPEKANPRSRERRLGDRPDDEEEEEEEEEDQQRDPDQTEGRGGKEQLKFNPEVAREHLTEYIEEVIRNKFESDSDFEYRYRDIYVEDLINHIITWADRNYQSPIGDRDFQVAVKKAPFYSISELHMIPLIDDGLYALLAQHLTAQPTPAINVNEIDEIGLRSLFPQMSAEDAKELIEFRRSPLVGGGPFPSVDAFYEYLLEKIPAYDATDIKLIQNQFIRAGLELVTEESNFKITVRAEVNGATRMIEANITLLPIENLQQRRGGALTGARQGVRIRNEEKPETGLRVTSMRIL